MRVYADTSFLLKLISNEPDSQIAVDQYRRLDLPPLFFLPLHALEVRNAILQRVFHQRRVLPSAERRHVAPERDAALARLENFIKHRAFLEVTVDLDATIARAIALSDAHTERLGTRAIDLLHVASALNLESEWFLTADLRQAQLAKSEGMQVTPNG